MPTLECEERDAPAPSGCGARLDRGKTRGYRCEQARGLSLTQRWGRLAAWLAALSIFGDNPRNVGERFRPPVALRLSGAITLSDM